MAYSFDEIMAYHPDNADIYREIKQFLPRLVPFIGAGLTQFAYCSWPDALKTLSGKLTNDANAQKITGLINSKHYLDAARKLEDFRTPTNLARDLAGIFLADKLEQKREQLPQEPISLLPYLFPELVLTTNFDETLETIYRECGHPFQTTFLPGHPELLRQLMLKGGVCGLFKLHGTVTGELIEYEKIVFTQAQYDRHYGKDSPLTRELKACFENRMMLFLGCSLDSDRTMELLQEVIHPGSSYYTVISCEPSERDEKVKQLGEKHIRAILYEKDHHEAVRVILEHLLEETNPKSYNALPVHAGALKSIDLSERFSYKAEIVPFTGRADELQALNTFLGDAHIAFRWWAITGPGGSGKSRLAYEFQKQLPSDWIVHYLDSGDYADLSSLTERLTQKTLLIADYVQENAKAIGIWMEQINERNRSQPIRVLLVERESGTNKAGPGWTEQLYANVRHEQKLKSACYQENFLVLQSLCDDDLLTIINNYALALKQHSRKVNHVLPDTTKLLLQKLKSIDPGFCRPLYAMFLTDAYVSGRDPKQWTRKDILDYLIEREQKRLKFSIQQTFGKPDEKLYTACLYLYGMATVLQNMSLEDLQQLCPNIWTIIQRKSDTFVSPASMLEQIGLVVKGTVFALRPDLMGEYFVYTWLLQHPDEVQQFLYSAWQRPDPTSVFFDRIIKDYSYLLNKSAEHWKLVVPSDIPALNDTALIDYIGFLVGAIIKCEIAKERDRQFNLLNKLASNNLMNLNVAIVFAKEMDIVGCFQNEHCIRDTIAILDRLAVEYPDVQDILVARARSLARLSYKQAEQSAQVTVARVESLAAEHPDVPDILSVLANGLANFIEKQDEQGAQDTIAHLESLVAEHPDVPDIVQSLAIGLCYLGKKQDERGLQDTLVRFGSLLVEHPNVPHIDDFCTFFLRDLSQKHDAIAHLESLVVKHPNVPVIAIVLAKSLANLSQKQDEQGARDTIARLESLAAERPDVLEILTALARGLADLITKQDEWNARNTIARLESLAAEHPNEKWIMIALAKGLFNLSQKQDEKGAQDTIARLESLAAEDPGCVGILNALAEGLFNLSIKQDEKGAQDTIARLKSLAAEHPNVLSIVFALAEGLFELRYKQDEQGARDTLTCLDNLAEVHPYVRAVVIEYANNQRKL